MSNSPPMLDALFQLTGVGVVQTDLTTGRLVRVNPAFCAMVGYRETELREMTLPELTHPEEPAREAERDAASSRNEHAGTYSLTRVVRRDGAVLWLELHTTRLQHAEGTCHLTVATDVTKRVAAETTLRKRNETLERRVMERTEALWASEQRFSQAFHRSPIPVCITTFGRETFVEVNGAFSALTGYAHDEVVDKTVFELGMWSSPEDQRKLAEVARAERGFRDLDLHLRDHEGRRHNVLVTAEVIRLEGYECYLKMFYDITERKQTEEEVHAAIREVMRDANWFSRSLLAQLANLRSGRPRRLAVTEPSRREWQVLERLAEGLSNDAIAADLGIATQTVRNYITSIYEKVGVRSRSEAVVWARERGNIEH